MIGAAELAKLKPGSVLVNTARGAVVDEGALAEALESGHLSSVGLDVFENEPEIHPGLIHHPRALLLPHMGTWTSETSEAMEQWVVKNVRMAVTDGRLHSRVPEQAELPYDTYSV